MLIKKFKAVFLPLLILIICLLGLICLNACSCDLKVGIVPESLEQGSWVHVPDLVGVNMDDVEIYVLYPDGNEVPTRDSRNGKKEFDLNTNMLFLSEVGEYTIVYGYNDKTLNVKILSTKDVSPPHFTQNATYNIVDEKNYLVFKNKVYSGEVFRFDDVVLEDPSGLDYSVCYRYVYQRVVSENGETEILSEPYEYYQEDSRRFIPDQAGTYKITLPARDLLGNRAEYYYYFNVAEKFTEADVFNADSGQYRICDPYSGDFDASSPYGESKDSAVIIAKFNKEKYAEQMVEGVGGIDGGWGDSTDDISIVEVDGRYALKAKYNGVYSPHFLLRIDFFKALNKGSFKNLYISYKFVKAEGYNKSGAINYSTLSAQVYAIPYSLESDIGAYIYSDNVRQTDAYTFILDSGAWKVATIDANKLFADTDSELAGLKLCVSGEIYIDKIWVSDVEFKDEPEDTEFDKVIMDFDEQGYMERVEKGSYFATPSASIISGTQMPSANVFPDSALNGKSGSGGALCVESMNSTDIYAGVKIKLFNSFSTTEYKYVNFRIYYDAKIKGGTNVEPFLVFYTEGGTITEEHAGKHYYHFVTGVETDDLVISPSGTINTPVYGNEIEKLWIDVRVDSKIFNFGEDGDVSCLDIVVCGKVHIDKIWLDN